MTCNVRVHRIKDEAMPERVYNMRLRKSWHHIAAQLNITIPQAYAYQAEYLKSRGGAKTLETILGQT